MTLDHWLFHLVHVRLAHAWLDAIMLLATTLGLFLLPGWVLGLLARRAPRSAVAAASAIAASFVSTLLLQEWVNRPRPVPVRDLLPVPGFPSFPSGHAAVVVAAVTVLLLSGVARRWAGVAIGSAFLVSVSRVYVGHHWPTDVLAGVVLGATAGALAHGFVALDGVSWRERARWLLWPQVAIVVLTSLLAYVGRLPLDPGSIAGGDKVLHFAMVGVLALLLNIWMRGRALRLGRLRIPLAVVAVLVLSGVDETSQAFSPNRSFDLGDWAANWSGVLTIGWLGGRLLVAAPPRSDAHAAASAS